MVSFERPLGNRDWTDPTMWPGQPHRQYNIALQCTGPESLYILISISSNSAILCDENTVLYIR